MIMHCSGASGKMPRKSWLSIPRRCPFSLANIPFGIISTASSPDPRPAVAIGEYALDLRAFASHGGFNPLKSSHDYLSIFSESTLNAFAACGRASHREVRHYLQNILAEDTSHPEILKSNVALRKGALPRLETITTHLPLSIGDYTDFFAGINHAFNVGTMFRGPANALNANYTHLPVGYHGRASSVVVSGTDIRRPRGQILPNPAAEPKIPAFKPTQRLDIELELGAFLCKGSRIGDIVPINEAEESIFGYVLLNDWSARDIQTWEYVPLGPFNAKNFGSSISPWVVLADTLEPFRCEGVINDTELLPYLQEQKKESVYDISLEVELISKFRTRLRMQVLSWKSACLRLS
jgi:fumarylacetoacetase